MAIEQCLPKQVVVSGRLVAEFSAQTPNLGSALNIVSGGASKRPSTRLATKQSQELILELSQNSGLDQNLIKCAKGGTSPGTFAHELLAISYAGWISPAFQLQVNRVFLDYRTGKLAPVEKRIEPKSKIRTLVEQLLEEVEAKTGERL